mgnify:FL=1|tara:strand:+ start:469 stop:1776 length:1308 start_codon:yes stop_codon:yes gene_type:complete
MAIFKATAIKIYEGDIDSYKLLGSKWKQKYGDLTGFLEEHGLIHKSKIPNYKGKGLDDWVKLRNTKTELGVKVAPYKPVSAKARDDMLKKIQPETIAQAKKMEKAGKIKSAEQAIANFEKQLKLDHARAKKDAIAATQRTGIPHDIGHGTDVKAGGQNYYANLAPEPALANQTKGAKKSKSPDLLMEANIPGGKHSQLGSFVDYMIDGEGSELLNTAEKTQTLHGRGGIQTIDQAQATARNRAMGGGSERVWTDMDALEASGANQYLQRGGKTLSPTSSIMEDADAVFNMKAKGWGPGGMMKTATGLSRGESLLRLAGGDVAGGTLGLLMTTPTFQKKAAALLAKQGVKLIPGVSLGSGALQAAGYAAGGQWTKAGISALSGVIGEIPGWGDAVSAAIELGLTADDMKKVKSKKVTKPKARYNKLRSTLRSVSNL